MATQLIIETQNVIEVAIEQPTVMARASQLAVEVATVQPVIKARMTQIVIEVKRGLTLFCPSLTMAVVGVPFSTTLIPFGGVPPYTFSIISGSLPPGLSLNTTTGAISGTPTLAGIYNFTAQVVDSNGLTATVSSGCPLTVVAAAPILLCPTNTSITLNQPYSGALIVVGGTPPYTFAIIGGALPAGLSLNTSTGVISGTPTIAGPYSYTAQVTDANGLTATVTCSFTVSGCPPPL